MLVFLKSSIEEISGFFLPEVDDLDGLVHIFCDGHSNHID